MTGKKGSRQRAPVNGKIIAHDIRASKGRDRRCIIMTNLVSSTVPGESSGLGSIVRL